MTFNYSAITFDKAIPDIDKTMLHKVKVERALFGISSLIWGALWFTIHREEKKEFEWDKILKSNLSQDAQDYIEECKDILKKEIAIYGVNTEDFNDIFELIFMSLKN